MTYLDDIINSFSSIATILAIPYYYIESSKKKIDKIEEIIESISHILLIKLSQNYFINKNELNAILENQLKKANLNTSIISIDQIIEKAVNKIEGNPLISTKEKFNLIQRTQLPNQSKKSFNLKILIFTTKYQKQISIFITIIVGAIAALIADEFSFFSKLASFNFYLYLLGVSLLLFIPTYFIIKLINFITNPKIQLESTDLYRESFAIINSNYSDAIEFTNINDNTKTLFHVNNIDYGSKNNVVETDSTIFNIGITRFLKIHKYISYEFISEDSTKINFTVKKISIINGSIDLDKITITITKDETKCIAIFYQAIDTINVEEFDLNGNLTQIERNNANYLISKEQNDMQIILSIDFQLIAFRYKNNLFKNSNYPNFNF